MNLAIKKTKNMDWTIKTKQKNIYPVIKAKQKRNMDLTIKTKQKHGLKYQNQTKKTWLQLSKQNKNMDWTIKTNKKKNMAPAIKTKQKKHGSSYQNEIKNMDPGAGTMKQV